MTNANDGLENEDEWGEGVQKEDPEPDIAKFEIFSYPADNTLKAYYDLWEENQLYIPDFQRNYVWDKKRASKLIESFLLGIPVPLVFLYVPKDKEDNRYWVIDGQQRIKSVISFLKGEFIDGQQVGQKFILEDVENSEWKGRSFAQLSEHDKAELQRTVMRATVIKQMDEKDNKSIYYIFERLNTGGMVLSPMEVRMCVSHGEFAETLKNLNELKIWRGIIRKPKNDKRLRDVEWVLRAIALSDEWQEYDKSMKGFLNDYMAKHQSESKVWLENKVNIFKNALDKAHRIVDNPFHVAGWSINLSAMDSLLVALISLDGKNVPDKGLKDAYDSLLENPQYLEIVQGGSGTTNKQNVQERIKLAIEAFSNLGG